MLEGMRGQVPHPNFIDKNKNKNQLAINTKAIKLYTSFSLFFTLATSYPTGHSAKRQKSTSRQGEGEKEL